MWLLRDTVGELENSRRNRRTMDRFISDVSWSCEGELRLCDTDAGMR